MNKKVISSVLAGAMAISTMGVVVSAAGNTTEGNVAFSAKAGLMEATIDATLPTDLETFINPYGAQVSTTATTGVVTGVKYSDGIISPTYSIVEEGGAAGLKVTATAKITGSKTVAIATKAVDEAKLAKLSDKQVFAFLNTTTDAVSNKPVFSSTAYNGNAQQLAFSEDGAKKSEIMNIAASGTGYFYVGGQCTPNPDTAWDSKDTITVDLILDLSPSAGAAADLTMKEIAVASGKIDFDAATTSYTLAASGSKTKAATIKATANDSTANVYVKYNGTLISTTAAASATAPGVTIATGTATVAPMKDGTPAAEVDYNAGDVIEFIIVNATTNESATYTIIFE